MIVILPFFSFTNISSHRWVFQKRKSQNCCCANYAGSASWDISVYNKQNSFPKASVHKIWPVYWRRVRKIYLIIIEITYCICMCNGCLGITAAFTYREQLIVLIENTQNVFSYCFSPLFWAKSRKGDEHVTLCSTKDHYQFWLPSNGRTVSMTLNHFCKEIVSNW